MSSHTLEGKKKSQNGVKRLVFSVLSILLEVIFLVGIFNGLNEYAVVIDNIDPCISDSRCSIVPDDWYEWRNEEDADAL